MLFIRYGKYPESSLYYIYCRITKNAVEIAFLFSKSNFRLSAGLVMSDNQLKEFFIEFAYKHASLKPCKTLIVVENCMRRNLIVLKPQRSKTKIMKTKKLDV